MTHTLDVVQNICYECSIEEHDFCVDGLFVPAFGNKADSHSYDLDWVDCQCYCKSTMNGRPF